MLGEYYESLEKIVLAIECFCRKIYSKVWYYRITLTTNSALGGHPVISIAPVS